MFQIKFRLEFALDISCHEVSVFFFRSESVYRLSVPALITTIVLTDGQYPFKT